MINRSQQSKQFAADACVWRAESFTVNGFSAAGSCALDVIPENNRCERPPRLVRHEPLDVRHRCNPSKVQAIPTRVDYIADLRRSGSDVTGRREAHREREEGLAHAQGLVKWSKMLQTVSPLQRVSDSLNKRSSVPLLDEGARLKLGPSTYHPVIHSAMNGVLCPIQRVAQSPACPPLPSISHLSLDLRRASQKLGHWSGTSRSWPPAYEGKNTGTLLIRQADSRLVVGRVDG
ncbi:hypothetical protein AX17_005716 [Amanita inopinata Kibby_2008]|nr:hypothetical protein AX17_005716 [Amanita inopinata Kibby_2008]